MVGHSVETAKGGKMGANPCLSGKIQGKTVKFAPLYVGKM